MTGVRCPSGSALGKTRSFRTQSLRLVLIVLFAAAQASCWEGVTREVAATVLSVDGVATVGATGGGEFLPLLPGAHPGKGAIIETAASSRAVIALLPNVLIQLDPGARIEIIRLGIAKDGNETGSAMRGRYAEVKLLSGRVFVSHDWGEAIAQFTVSTPQGTLTTSSNALFCLHSEAERTRVTSVSGTVGFRPSADAAATAIPPGHLGEWSAAASTVVAAETDARGQADLEQALEVEEKLRALRERIRNVPLGR